MDKGRLCFATKEYLIGSHRNTSVSDAVAVDVTSGDLAQSLGILSSERPVSKVLNADPLHFRVSKT